MNAGPRKPIGLGEVAALAGRTFVGEWRKVEADRAQSFFHGTYLDCAYGEDIGPGYPEGMLEGFHLLSLLDWLSAELVGRIHGFNYGLEGVRFLAPVTVHDALRLRLSVRSVEPRDSGIRVQFAVTIDIQGRSSPALIADWIVLAQAPPASD